MNPMATLREDGFTLTWSPVYEGSEYLVFLERCDRQYLETGGVDCERILSENVTLATPDPTTNIAAVADSVQLVSEKVLDLCRFYYNVRIDALGADARMVFRETAVLAKSRQECEENLAAILTGVLVCVSVLILICIFATVYYRRRRRTPPAPAPLQRIARVRSKVYTRLYPKEKYERPLAKKEFVAKAEELLRLGEEEEEDGGPGKNTSFQGIEPLERRISAKVSAEFAELEQICFHTIQRRVSVANLAENRLRNRYNDIVPYDANRVKLKYKLKLPNETSFESDYVNASYVGATVAAAASATATATTTAPAGCSRRESILNNPALSFASMDPGFIAAQGPGEDTIRLFWEMVWQNNVRVIVMLTRIVEGFGFNSAKCSQYWPPGPVGSKKKVGGDLEIQLFDDQETEHYTVRKLDVTRTRTTTIAAAASSNGGGGSLEGSFDSNSCGNGTREIVQIQYTSWPDRSAPSDASALLQLIEVTKALDARYNEEVKAPWVVHCSAGVGRTGTFIAVAQLLKVVDDRCARSVDVFNLVYELRKERKHMVQTEQQYAYVYECALEYYMRRSKVAREIDAEQEKNKDSANGGS